MNKTKVESYENIIDKYTLEKTEMFINDTINEIIKKDIDDRGVNENELIKMQNKKNKMINALRSCGIGDIASKQFVKDYIYGLLAITYEVDENNVNFIMNFDHPNSLSAGDKFEILLYRYKKIYGYNALQELFEKYNLGNYRKESNDVLCYIDKEEIEKIYLEENIRLEFEEKLDLLTQKIYARNKGLGCIDTIRDMCIDGISGGVSGLPEDFVSKSQELEYYLRNGHFNELPRSYDSIWLFYKGRTIHLRFLSFNSFNELQRICMNIYRFSSPGDLTQTRGYIANKMADGSRVVVLRPPFCETWVFFVRKFDIPEVTAEQLIKGKNSDIVIETIKYLIKGCRTICITGAQGTGKTTLLTAIMGYIYTTHTLRLFEMFFEAHLRKRYPSKNIVTLRETESIKGQEILDITKKTDGDITVIQEMADDYSVVYFIQAKQVGGKCSYSTHHANTMEALIEALRNSLLKSKIFNDEKLAEKQVVNVLNFNIHLENIWGKRCISRITECIPIEEEEYPTDYRKAKTFDEKMDAFFETLLVYMKKCTDFKSYKYKNIIEYDYEKNEYVLKNMLSDKSIKEIRKELIDEDQKEFSNYIEMIKSNFKPKEILIK